MTSRSRGAVPGVIVFLVCAFFTGCGASSTSATNPSATGATTSEAAASEAQGSATAPPSGGYSYSEKRMEVFLGACERAEKLKGVYAPSERCLCYVRNAEASVPEARFLSERAALIRKELSQAKALAAVVKNCSTETNAEREEHDANARKALREEQAGEG